MFNINFNIINVKVVKNTTKQNIPRLACKDKQRFSIFAFCYNE